MKVQILGFPNSYTHRDRANFRRAFFRTDFCRVLERNRISFFTSFHYGVAKVVAEVDDDQKVLIIMALPPNLTLEPYSG